MTRIGGCKYFNAYPFGICFTLVELLVSMTIIAILSSMMVTVVVTSISSSRTSACASHLKQIATAVMVYEDEFSQAANFPEGNSYTWQAEMATNPFICLWKSGHMDSAGLLQCPGAAAVGIARNASNPNSVEYCAKNGTVYTGNHSFGIPSNYAFRTYYYEPSYKKGPPFLLADAGYDTVGGDEVATKNHNKDSWSANVACTDGHVIGTDKNGFIDGVPYNIWKLASAGVIAPGNCQWTTYSGSTEIIKIGQTLCPQTKDNGK